MKLAFALGFAALALLAPGASAYPNHAYPCDIHAVDGVCFGDVQYGSCGGTEQYDGVTGAAVKFDGQYLADVGAVEQCDTGPGGFSRHATIVYVETRYATLAWADEQRENDETYCSEWACDPEGCSWWVYYPGAYRRVDCVLVGSPPNPGWGQLTAGNAAAPPVCVGVPATGIIGGGVCEYERAQGPCDEYSEAWTGASASVSGLVGVSAGGYEVRCDPAGPAPASSSHGVGVNAWGVAGQYHAGWQESRAGSLPPACGTRVVGLPAGDLSLGCPVGPPPNPGWGHVLP